MNVYCFYFSMASNSPALVPFSATCSVCGGVYALLAMVTQIGNTPLKKKKNPPFGETSVNRDVWISSIVLMASIPVSHFPVSL